MSHAVVETQLARDEMRLIGFAVAPLNAEHLLQRYDVGVNLFQDTDDSRGVETPVNPDAFVHVVSDNSKFTDLSHSRLILTISNSAPLLPSRCK